MAKRNRRKAPANLPEEPSVVSEPVSAEDISQRLFVAAALAAITILFYFRVCSYEFIPTDDQFHILTNPNLNPVSSSGLANLWTHAYGDLYIPVSYMVFALVCLVAKGHGGAYMPGPFHAANLLLHTANVLLVYALILRFVRKPWAAGFGALLFAIHPVQQESVAWISEIRGTVSALFAFLALLGYLRCAQDSFPEGVCASVRSPLSAGEHSARREPKPPHPNPLLGKEREPESNPAKFWALWMLSTVSFGLSMLSKPTAVAVPLIATALDLWMVGRKPLDVLKWAGQWVVLALIIVVVTSKAQQVDQMVLIPVWERVGVVFDTLGFYTAHVLVPLNLSFDYARTPHHVVGHAWGCATICLGALATLTIVWLGRGRPWVWACAGVFAAAILPDSGLVPFEYETISTVADRYMYVAMLGPSLALAYALSQWPSRAGIGLAAAILVVYGIASEATLTRWHDQKHLFIATTRLHPDSWYAWSNLGSYYSGIGDIDHGIDATNHALAIMPDYPIGLNLLSSLLAAKGDMQGAIAAAQLAVTTHPDYTPPYGQLGVLLVRVGRYADAEQVLQNGLLRGVPMSEAGSMQYCWGVALEYQHDIPDAKLHYVEAVKIDPSNTQYRDALNRLSTGAQ